METFLIKALQLIVALVILVTVHEFGHYIFARIFGVKVNRFYLFFNPWFSILKYDPRKGTLKIFSRDDEHSLATLNVSKPHPAAPNSKPSWRDTIYGLGWLPLGGYCDIAGMVDETKSSKDLASEPQPWEFRSKAAWKRLLVMVAGVLFNFLLAIVIYIGIAFHWGELAFNFDKVDEGMNFSEQMQKAGFKDGDILLKINGEKISPTADGVSWEIIQPGTHVTLLRNHADTINVIVDNSLIDSIVEANVLPMSIRVPVYVDSVMAGEGAAKAGLKRGDRIVGIGNDTTPTQTEFYPVLTAAAEKTVDLKVIRNDSLITLPAEVNSDGKLGILLRNPKDIYNMSEIHYTFLEAVPRGIQLGTDKLVMYVSSLKMLFTKSGAKSVGGFGTLGNMFPDKWDWYSFWNIAAFLSVILAFMNIIPIPALDGGYTLFLLIEIITRRKPSERFIEVANMIGMGFLLLLLVYANLNDVIRLTQ